MLTIKKRFEIVLQRFALSMPFAESELVYSNPYELLVAVILSAQCTDKRVNQITPAFFKRFPTVEMLANADVSAVFELIKSCSYPNNKAKHLKEMAIKVVNDFQGEIPDAPELLQQIPGVGRKTAHVVASVFFQKPLLAVDTHVFRVSKRIGLTQNAKTPLQTEKQLIKYIPENQIRVAHHWLILHGRYVCKARNPLCNNCMLKDVCRFFNQNNPQK